MTINPERNIHEPGHWACINGEYFCHCYWHHIDEWYGVSTYMVCGECLHVYQTEKSLRKAYRDVTRKLGYPISGNGAVNRFYSTWFYVKSWFKRADDIFFCPFCSHDF